MKTTEPGSSGRTQTAGSLDGGESRSATDSFDSNAAGHSGRGTVPLCVALFLLTLWTFLPAINNDFVGFDDADYVTANPHVRAGLSWQGITWAMSSTEVSNWHPLTWLSHMLDCQLFGLQAWGHHLTSVTLHAANTVLVFLVFRRLTGAILRSLVIAALFGLHPLRVESVAWIAERKDILSAMFWMLALWAYARFAGEFKKGSGRYRLFYGLSFAFFCLGLMSKPMVVTLPFVLLLLDYWPLVLFDRKHVSDLLLQKVPYLLAAAAASCVTFFVQKSAGAMVVNLPFIDRMENAVVSYCRYLGKLCYPLNLSVVYPYPSHWPVSTVLLSALLLVAVSVWVIALRRPRPYLAVGWFWFLGTLVPVVGLVQVGTQAMADRYTYVPLLGILLLLVWGVCDVTRCWPRQTAIRTAAAAGMILLCAALTHRQLDYWSDNEVLFRHALAITRDNPTAHFCLGFVLGKKGELDAAISEYQNALKLSPGFVDVHDSLGYMLAKKGNLDEAISEYRETLRLKPNHPAAHYHLGLALDRKGSLDEAIDHFQQALRLNPDLPDAHNDLGVAWGRKGYADRAILEFQQAAMLEPDSAEIRYNLGNALVRKGLLEEAIKQFYEALRLDPGHVEAHNNLGVALTRSGRLQEAAEQFQEALRLKPDYDEARKNLRAVSGPKRVFEKQAPVPGTQ